MAFDFPSAPTSGQIYTGHGISFRWADYAWLPISTGGGVGEAPMDGQQYARSNASWVIVTSMPAIIDGGTF